MFYRASDASKVAVVDLCHRLHQGGVVVDTEQESEHIDRLGQVLLEREDYLQLVVGRLRDQRVELPKERRLAARLLD